jgi:hypothetical protein
VCLHEHESEVNRSNLARVSRRCDIDRKHLVVENVEPLSSESVDVLLAAVKEPDVVSAGS